MKLTTRKREDDAAPSPTQEDLGPLPTMTGADRAAIFAAMLDEASAGRLKWYTAEGLVGTRFQVWLEPEAVRLSMAEWAVTRGYLLMLDIAAGTFAYRPAPADALRKGA